MSFASDNWAGASDRVMALLAEANAGPAPAYGADAWTRRADAAVAEFFEHEVATFCVATGSAANSLALAALLKPGGVVFCHVDAHIARDEAGAPVLFAPGTVLHLVDGPAGRIGIDDLAAALASYRPGNVHQGRPGVLSLTNINEIGQPYTPDETADLAAQAKARAMAVHLDGARLMNAVACGLAPADLTWRAGVDAVSLGLTKTGGWCAEVVVFFDPARAEDARYRHKQGAMMFSKNRFAAAQVVALLTDGHALDLARHANAMAARLADALAAAGAVLLYPAGSNEVFAWLTAAAADRLAPAGITAYPWHAYSGRHPAPPTPEHGLHRFVASFRTTADEVERAAAAVAG